MSAKSSSVSGNPASTADRVSKTLAANQSTDNTKTCIGRKPSRTTKRPATSSASSSPPRRATTTTAPTTRTSPDSASHWPRSSVATCRPSTTCCSTSSPSARVCTAPSKKLLGLLSNGKDVLGDLGVEGKGLEIAGQLLGFAQDQSSASTAATTKGAQDILQLPSILQILTVEAFAKKGDLRQIAPTAGGDQQLNKEFIGKNGQLILPTTQAQAYDFAKWIGDLKVSPATTNSINSGISAASGLSGNESRGNGVGSAP